MKKQIVWIFIIGVTLVTIAFFHLNPKYGFIGKDRFNYSVSRELDLSKFQVKYGFFTLNRNSDSILFCTESDILFNGLTSFPKRIEYGENDFLLIYDSTYYYQFRQFKTCGRAYHNYNFHIEKSDSGLIAFILIKGINGTEFKRKMNLISNVNNLRCNAPKENAGYIYNMKELVKK